MRAHQDSSARVRVLLWLLAGGLLAALFAPTLMWLLRSWQVHPYYTHGPLVPIVAAWFLWRERALLARREGNASWIALVVAGIGVHLAARPWDAHAVSAVGLLAVLAGMALLAGGRAALRAAVLPLVLLGLAIPVPHVERLAPPLAEAVARSAAVAAGSIGTAVVQVGAQLTVGDGTFVVGAPCSGLRSILALATLAVVVAGMADGPRGARAALVASAIPLALAANWLRLTGFLWLAQESGAHHALSLYHSLSSPLLVLASTAGLLLLASAFGCHVRARA